MIWNPAKLVALLLTLIFWVILALFVVGCAGTTYQTIPNAMCEDAQDYPTKYNMMDSQDGSKNPNAQINFLQLKY